ncbi:MAG: CopG family transcriptional regulator [Gammaproteobacteria bacterium]|nr:CopG family transcriptional regulator [Gammaproteobacteria bacterium]MBU1724195.1 CopG family transcriptional regulator [Gammaproteobacteria bacterium]MBU2005060.1 CopG family transcriptional regulator [Gammaproteobacteria bacterium]
MARETITFRTEADKRQALDQLAQALGQDRTATLNQAIDTLLDIYDWQVRHIETGRKQARNGEFVDESVWRKALRRNIS